MNKELIYQNKKIFYRIIGNGKPVVLIHGFGEDGNIWNNQVEYLKDQFKLIIPDLPGSGQSEMIDDMSIEGMAELLKAIVEASPNPSAEKASPSPSEGGVSDSDTSNRQDSFKESDSKNPPSEGREALSLIGHSMGGYITLAFAEKYPGNLSAFGLFHSTAYADSEEKKAIRRKGIEFIKQHGAFEFLKTTIPNLFAADAINEKEQLIIQGHNFAQPSLVSYYEAMIQRPDRTDLLQKATVPVLFIMGKYDNAIPLEDGLQQCHLPEKSYIYVLRNSGHMGMLEEKLKSNDILVKFLLDS